MFRVGSLFVLAALWAVASAGSLTKAGLIGLVQQKVDSKVIIALIERDCVDFEISASDVSELAPLVPAEVLEAAIKCRKASRASETSPKPSSAPAGSSTPSPWSAYIPAIGQTLFFKLGDTKSDVDTALAKAGFELSGSNPSMKCYRSKPVVENCEAWSNDVQWKFERPESFASEEGLALEFRDGRLFELCHYMTFNDRATTLETYRNLRTAIAGVYRSSPGHLGFFRRKILSAVIPLGSIEDTGIWKASAGTAVVVLFKSPDTHTVMFISTLNPL